MSKATFNPTVFNRSANVTFAQVLAHMAERRRVLKGGLGMAAMTMFSGAGLAGCGSDDASAVGSDSGVAPTPATASPAAGPKLAFDSIPGSRTDAVVVPPGYRAQVLAPWGTPLNDLAAEWLPDGSNTATDQANSIGMHHDGMQFFPLDGSSTDGLLVINHEYIDEAALHPNGPTRDGSGLRTVADEVRKEINAHGVSVVRIRMDGAGDWAVIRNDPRNKRYTGASVFDVAGPLAGSERLLTRFSAGQSVARGTLNNCGNGYTPWGTYLTCEENWPEYFVNTGTLSDDQARIGVARTATRYGWADLAGDTTQVDDEFARFDLTPHGAAASDDYRNEATGHGYIVEIDPYDPARRGIKRTSMGRFRHEGCWPGKLEPGQPVVFYSGHDARGEYIYKFVSDVPWDPADADPADRLAIGAKYFDTGTLYVARFDADGTGRWLALTPANPALARFADLADIIVNTIEAADLVGATPMDRPEWGAVDPLTGTVYFTLTNNTRRGTTGTVGEADKHARSPVDAANPRQNNANGHIIRWDETADPTRFNWDIFLFGSFASAPGDVNRSGLTDLNQFASPDGLVFDSRGILWIQTDNGAPEVADYTNDQMLAVVPADLVGPDGGRVPVSADNQAELRRFFVGPNGCEVTGLAFAPDNATCFANIQHPGNWPSSADAAAATPPGVTLRPRAATVVIRRLDGGAIGV